MGIKRRRNGSKPVSPTPQKTETMTVEVTPEQIAKAQEEQREQIAQLRGALRVLINGSQIDVCLAALVLVLTELGDRLPSGFEKIVAMLSDARLTVLRNRELAAKAAADQSHPPVEPVNANAPG